MTDIVSEAGRKGEAVGIAWKAPKDQRLSYRVTPSAGSIMNAKSIGGQMVALARLLESVAKETDPDVKWMIGITAAYTEADGSFNFDLVLMPKSEDVKKKQGNLPFTPEEQPKE